MCVCSVRLNERLQRGVGDNKKLAYLIDLKTVAVGKTVDKEDKNLGKNFSSTCFLLTLSDLSLFSFFSFFSFLCPNSTL